VAGVIITEMREDDLAVVESLDAHAFGPTLPGAADRMAQLREELARPWALLRVARTREDPSTVVGFVLAWRVVDELHILNVAVAPDRRRQGIGATLLRLVLDEARSSGAARCLLEVRRSNTSALALYASLGFSPFNERRAYYPDGEDAIELDLRLS
jgi:[ribosomal protein S18]-alanine N-acetyltransferase